MLEVRCSACSNRGHTKKKCWQIIRYPNWHSRSKKNPQKKIGANRQGQQNQSYGGRAKGSGLENANQAAVAETPVPGLTTQQIQQLLQNVANRFKQRQSTVSHSEETDEELDYSFVGTAICFHAEQDVVNWIIDTGATDHTTSLPNCLVKSKSNDDNFCIKLSNGTQVPINHIGDVQLCNDLILKVVPAFKYNLLPVSKLCKDNNCVAIFHD